MKILMISPYFHPAVGGVETHLIDLVDHFKDRKLSVDVRTYKAFGVRNRGKSNEASGSVRIHRMWWPDSNLIFTLEKYPKLKFLYLFLGLFVDCFFYMLLHSRDITVIQAHGFVAAFIAIPLGRIFNKRVVVNTHVGFSLSDNLITRMIIGVLRRADKILVLTSGIKNSLINLGIDSEKIIIYHYWVDQKFFKPIFKAKAKLGWEKRFIVLFVGRLIEVKGVKTIIELAKRLPKATFVIAGSGPLSEYVVESSKKYKNLLFLGKIDNKDLPKYYSGADVLLIPSKIVKQEYEEGIPRVMIEALSCGLPVVATRTGGIPDVLDSKIGYMVDDHQQKMTMIFSKIYSSKKLLLELSRNCRKFALDNFGKKSSQIIEESII